MENNEMENNVDINEKILSKLPKFDVEEKIKQMLQ